MTIPKSAVVMLLYGIVATVVLTQGESAIAQQQQIEPAELQRQMEDAAGRYQHFATSNIISNRLNDERRWPKEFTVEQAKLFGELKTWLASPDSLRAMIRHQDPKVRTLALGALFIREDPHDLPLIASLVNDRTPTLTDVHMSFNSGPIASPAEFQSPQTVGDVAKEMLQLYGATKFPEYWQERQARKTCASWFRVKVDRATRCISPLQRQYRDDIERVIEEVKGLPLVDRVWTQIFLRSFYCSSLEGVLTDADCIASLKEIGPDQVVRFLQQKQVTDDPDIRFDDGNAETQDVHSRMAHFILQRAPSVLRAQDAAALLECEKSAVRNASPAWAAAAAELVAPSDPNEANRIIDGALQRFPLKGILGERYQAMLIGTLWKIGGAKEQQKIVDWFYQTQGKVLAESSDESNHGPLDFLRLVRKTARQDTNELLAALVIAPSFDQADWSVLKEMLEIASTGRPKPLVTREMMYRAQPASRNPQRLAMVAEWRELLIRHYQKRE
ncbi:MAG: repeat protein [Schlesneria sp.]|nr:repeat protein [Schlesneria sp.]